VLSGAKTTTTALFLPDEPLAEVGQRLAVVDSAGRRVAVIELTDVRVVRLSDVDLRHAVDEGDESMAEWRANHEKSWHSKEVRAEAGADFLVGDDLLNKITGRG
jgi:uncharacterized protein YhfF